MTTLAQARAMQAAQRAARARGVVAPMQALQRRALAAAVAEKKQRAQDLRSAPFEELLAASKEKQKQKTKKEKPKGVLGAVIGNPIVKNALVPLQMLDTGRRAVVSTAQELGDAVNGQGFSGKDWMAQVKDPSYGAGQMLNHFGIQSDNKWVNRALGFAGDVAADPFTYLTLGGSQVPGLAGRAALAETAARRGAHLGEQGVEDLVSRIAKYGTHDLSPAERELLQISDPGLRFAGKRIPGTGELANVLGKSGRGVANAVNDTPIGKGLRALSAGRSPEVRAAVEKMATGAGEGSMADAAATLHLRNVGKGTHREFEGIFAKAARDVGKALRKHPNAVHDLESGVDSEGARLLEGFLSTVRKGGMEHGVKINELERYVPHLQTDTLKDFMGRTKNNLVKDTLDSSSGRSATRVFRKGTYTIGGKQVTFDGTIAGMTKELQAKFPKELGGRKLFEDNPEYLAARYVQDVARDAGKAQTLLTGLETTPYAVKPLQEVEQQIPTGRGQTVIDEQAVKAGKEAEKKAQGAFWRSHANVEDARVNAATAVADLAEKQGQDASALRQLAETPSPRTVKKTVDSMDEAERHMMDAIDSLPDYHDPDLAPTIDVVKDYVKLKASLGPKADAVFNAKDFLATAKKGTFNEEMKTVLAEGWKKMGGDVLGEDVAVSQAVSDALENVYKLIDTNKFWQAVDTYTKFFKAYATMTPGFHVRNAMDSTFKNASDGVAAEAMGAGAKFWTVFRRNADKDYLTALEKAGFSRDESQYAISAVYRSGAGGQYSAEELGHAVNEAKSRFGKAIDKATHNKLTETSAAMGERVEGMARAGMALDSFRNGSALEEAVARIKRVHFDYSEVNEMDRMMKRLIPFWTFMSRNVPLQVQQMWLKPNLYLKYQSFLRDFNQQDPNAVIPTGIAERNGLLLGSGKPGTWALTPDLSQNRLISDVTAMQDPVRMLANANPLLRVPAELIAHRNFYNDYPIDANHFEKADKEMSLLRYLGLTDTAGNGDQVIDSRIPYALRNLIPPLSLAQRATGSGGSYRDGEPYNYYTDDGKQIQTGLQFLGIPLNRVTSAAVKREENARKRSKKSSTKDDARARALKNFGK